MGQNPLLGGGGSTTDTADGEINQSRHDFDSEARERPCKGERSLQLHGKLERPNIQFACAERAAPNHLLNRPSWLLSATAQPKTILLNLSSVVLARSITHPSSYHSFTMEVYGQYSQGSRERNRSASSLNHLSLAPLTTRLPLRFEDYDAINSVPPHTSYIQGRSAPTTPRLLSVSRSPTGHRTPTSRSARAATPGRNTDNTNALPKSKSAGHLAAAAAAAAHRAKARSRTTATTPTSTRRPHTANSTGNRHAHAHAHAPGIGSEFPDTDWFLRVGALIASETRESKGQSWLVSRAASSHNLVAAGLDEEASDLYTVARERVLGSSRRGSRDYGYGHGYGNGLPSSPSGHAGHAGSSGRFAASRSQSRVGSCTMTPAEEKRQDELAQKEEEDYFGLVMAVKNGGVVKEKEREKEAWEKEVEGIPGPDFVNLNEPLEAVDQADEEEEDTLVYDEAYIRRLARQGFMGSWFMRWFPVDSIPGHEDGQDDGADEEEDEAEEGEEGEEEEDLAMLIEEERLRQERRSASLKRLQECTITPLDASDVPPPKEDQGAWNDATWLLTVAARALFG